MSTHSAGRGVQVVFSLLLLVLACRTGTLAASAQAPAREFLIASDLHFNPMADPKLVDELNAAPFTKWEAILNRSTSTAFSQYGQDPNWWLLRSSLNAIRTTLPRPAFILVTGDMLAHRFPTTFKQTAKHNDPESYRKFVLKTMEFVAQQLQRRFPGARIMITPGNNDDDCGDYALMASGPFLQDTAALARKLARGNADFASSWATLGSYDTPHPTVRNARIISLNTIFFSARYQPQQFSEGCANVPSTAPDDLVAWLKERLRLAQQAHEKVWLMFHIPPGMDGYSTMSRYQTLLKSKSGEPPAQVCTAALVPMWAPKWTAQFDELLAQYKDTVIASFAGHTHNDDFRVINAATGASFVLINPAVSPIFGENPGFRVATAGRDGALLDTSVYYLTNLIFANSTTAGVWEKEYRFSKAWKTERVDASSLSAIYTAIARDDSARADWLKLYNVSSSDVHLPAGSAPFFYCAIEGLDAESYGNCTCPALSHTQ